MEGVGRRVLPKDGIDLIALIHQETITVEDIRKAARAVSGSEEGADYFMTKRHDVFRGRTVAETVEAGEARVVLGALLNAAGI